MPSLAATERLNYMWPKRSPRAVWTLSEASSLVVVHMVTIIEPTTRSVQTDDFNDDCPLMRYQ